MSLHIKPCLTDTRFNYILATRVIYCTVGIQQNNVVAIINVQKVKLTAAHCSECQEFATTKSRYTKGVKMLLDSSSLIAQHCVDMNSGHSVLITWHVKNQIALKRVSIATESICNCRSVFPLMAYIAIECADKNVIPHSAIRLKPYCHNHHSSHTLTLFPHAHMVEY